ncbi:uncharacterized protein LOC100573988 [Acyrthosiphon pisum]|uniref:Uncharacterized protein n=1 Tax=Acyrthosiphon pisum TaxID=7029 RepID=A0A8R2NN03_ACYPI|nr:uncharacterized protein LOC100573988 [Acyrthosiphon pisum]|eukprot:XP_003240883.1 PREDICTED: uncharacterized protein LOC100573988 [Acyrthosiphon pisum]
MNILKDRRVAEYISSLNGLSSNQYIMFTFCECINNNNTPEDAHSNIAEPCSSNLAELAADRKNVRLIQMYITITSYFKADTMKFLVNKMLECKDVETVEHYYNVLDKNLKLHPPCAQYMDEEYEQLLLSSYRKYFGEMTLWDYIIECLKNITRGSLLYGDDDAFDLAFKRCFCFCICILQVDFEVSKNKNKRSLAAKCLNYKLERETRMNEISTLLDKSYNTGYNFKMSVIHLAILVSQLQCN